MMLSKRAEEGWTGPTRRHRQDKIGDGDHDQTKAPRNGTFAEKLTKS